MKEKSRPATAGGLLPLPLSSPGSSWRGGTLGEVAKTKGGRIDPFSRIPKKDCWQQVEAFLWPLLKEMRAG